MKRWAKSNRTSAELRILILVGLATVPYGKDRFPLSVGKLSRDSGLTRRTVEKALNSLLGTGWLVKHGVTTVKVGNQNYRVSVLSIGTGPDDGSRPVLDDGSGGGTSPGPDDGSGGTRPVLEDGISPVLEDGNQTRPRLRTDPGSSKPGKTNLVKRECADDAHKCATDDAHSTGLPTGHSLSSSGRQSTKRPQRGISPELQASFDRFWAAYPRKVNRKKALEEWCRLNPSADLVDQILKAVEEQKGSRQWQDPAFIPHPATWLKDRRWTDQPAKTKGQADLERIRERTKRIILGEGADQQTPSA